MKIEGETIGVMQVQSCQLDAYSQEDMDLLSALANVAAIAIQNVRLYQEIRRRALEQGTASRIAYALNTLDVRDAFPVMLE
jgi:GAF domain-containing protein